MKEQAKRQPILTGNFVIVKAPHAALFYVQARAADIKFCTFHIKFHFESMFCDKKFMRQEKEKGRIEQV